MTNYVEIKHDLLGLVTCKCIPSGKTKTEGELTYAEFLCINPKCTATRIWATREQLVDNPQDKG